MKSTLTLCLLSIMLVVGCTPYPRYRAHADMTPREQRPDDQYLTTGEFLKLGMILQRSLGRPYRGRSKYEPGVDCSRFTRDAFREYNNTMLPPTAAEQFGQGTEIARRRLKFGDLVFFRTERDRISHVGVFIGHNEFIHASSSRGVIISNMGEKYWSRRYAGARRVIESNTE
jgi:cell wall-associated NlpC family hydrolase